MAKVVSKPPKKSDVLREIFAKSPEATIAEVQAILKAKKVKISLSLINKLKSGSGAYKRSKNAGKLSKADHIRAAFEALGQTARPRDVIEHLKGKRVTVTSAQVSNLKKIITNGPELTTTGKSMGTNGHTNLQALLGAKVLVTTVGSLDNAYAALEGLRKLGVMS